MNSDLAPVESEEGKALQERSPALQVRFIHILARSNANVRCRIEEIQQEKESACSCRQLDFARAWSISLICMAKAFFEHPHGVLDGNCFTIILVCVGVSIFRSIYPSLSP